MQTDDGQKIRGNGKFKIHKFEPIEGVKYHEFNYIPAALRQENLYMTNEYGWLCWLKTKDLTKY